MVDVNFKMEQGNLEHLLGRVLVYAPIFKTKTTNYTFACSFLPDTMGDLNEYPLFIQNKLSDFMDNLSSDFPVLLSGMLINPKLFNKFTGDVISSKGYLDFPNPLTILKECINHYWGIYYSQQIPFEDISFSSVKSFSYEKSPAPDLTTIRDFFHNTKGNVSLSFALSSLCPDEQHIASTYNKLKSLIVNGSLKRDRDGLIFPPSKNN